MYSDYEALKANLCSLQEKVTSEKESKDIEIAKQIIRYVYNKNGHINTISFEVVDLLIEINNVVDELNDCTYDANCNRR